LAETAGHRSLLIYLGLMGYLVLAKVALGLVTVEFIAASQAEILGWPVIGFIALAGSISVWLWLRMGLPGLWDASVSTRKRWLLPALVGLGLGAANLTLQAFRNGTLAIRQSTAGLATWPNTSTAMTAPTAERGRATAWRPTRALCGTASSW
jgi:hypothetical protein